MSTARTLSNVFTLLSHGASVATAACKSLLFLDISKDDFANAQSIFPAVGHTMGASSATLIAARLLALKGSGTLTAALSVLPALTLEYVYASDLSDENKTILTIAAFTLNTALNWLDYRCNDSIPCVSLERLSLSVESLQSALSIATLSPMLLNNNGMFKPSAIPDITRPLAQATGIASAANAAIKGLSGLTQFVLNQRALQEEKKDYEEDGHYRSLPENNRQRSGARAVVRV